MSKTDNNRKYYINDDGVAVMRVTEVLKVLAKDQLVTWANMLGLKGIEYKKELDRTSRIGTMVHALIEDYMDPHTLAMMDYEAYGIEDDESKLEASNAIASFMAWYDKMKDRYKVKFTEKVVVGKVLGGTIDCGIEGFKDPNKVIFVDYKTSKDFFLSQFLQLAGYVIIYEEVNGPNTVEGVMVVLANKNGKPGRAKMIRRENLDPLIICFKCLFSTANATKTLNSCWWNFTEVVQ